MIVGCGEWGFRDLPLADHFEIAARLGFRTLEFGIGGGQTGRLPEQPGPQDIDHLRSLADRFQIRTPFCCIENDFTLPDAAAHAEMVAKVLDQLEVAADCEATHVRLFAGFTPAEEMTESIWQRMTDAFEISQAACADLGLQIAIETHGAITFGPDGSARHRHTVSTDPASLKRLIDELPLEVGFNYDPGNLKAVNPMDRTCQLDLLNSRTNYCHLKDWNPSGEGWVACAIGDDDLDYRPILQGMDFNGVYLIEYEPVGDVEAGIQRSLAYLRDVVSEVRFE
ncbi:MAG: sugar phosphate isomerase/epimerase [Phycisphaerae bacterium]|nr:sugar phosphate isomerase/epimerase [Phycisphaerae bacterium]